MSNELMFTFKFNVGEFVIYKDVIRTVDGIKGGRTFVGEVTGRRCDCVAIGDGATENTKWYQIDNDAWFPAIQIKRTV